MLGFRTGKKTAQTENRRIRKKYENLGNLAKKFFKRSLRETQNRI
jgi:hypothetical protein